MKDEVPKHLTNSSINDADEKVITGMQQATSISIFTSSIHFYKHIFYILKKSVIITLKLGHQKCIFGTTNRR